MLFNYLLECAHCFLPRQENKNTDWKESGILGPVQFSSIQFSKHLLSEVLGAGLWARSWGSRE